MSAVDRDLVAALRAELAAIDPSRACDLSAELLGLGLGTSGATGDPRDTGAAAAPVAAPVATRPTTGRWAQTSRDPVLARVALRLSRRGVPPTGPDFDWDASPDHCRMAYLRGLFLARGSLSLAGARTHLEFVVEPAEAPDLARWLRSAGMPASWRVRRGRGAVTWKSSETVGLFLRRIGAGAALLELEARQVSRALRGELNRILNAESSNLQRSVAAAGRQLAAIETLESDGRLATQSYAVRLIADARRETPEATLADLADRVGLHRSAVQRALERMERLAEAEARAT
ncbi:MAG: DNA-binding protein WhiA [Chloroflexota bacterium]